MLLIDEVALLVEGVVKLETNTLIPGRVIAEGRTNSA